MVWSVTQWIAAAKAWPVVIILTSLPAVFGLLNLTACASAPAPPPCPTCPTITSPAAAGPPMEGEAVRTDRSLDLTLVAFSEDGSRLCLQSDDQIIGNSYTVFSTDTLKVIKMYNYLPFNRKAVWRRAKRRQKLVALSQGTATSARTGVTFMAADTPTHVVIYAMSGERSVPWFRVPRLKDEDGQRATISVKHLLVSPDDSHVVMVHRQTLAGTPGFATDAVHTIPIDAAWFPF